MKEHTAIKAFIYIAALAGLLGFSDAGLAQSEAIEALNGAGNQSTATTTTQPHPMAGRLATDLDRYNGVNPADFDARTATAAKEPSRHESRVARELSSEIDTYNATASGDFVPQTSAAGSEQQATPLADQLASELIRFNRSGGSLVN